VEQIDAGPKGAVLSFRNQSFANPEGLIAFIGKEGAGVKLQPDHKLVYYEDWPEPKDRLEGARKVLSELAGIAGRVKKAA
jgi:transcription-repair coupling factor (superfamily II helicase)